MPDRKSDMHKSGLDRLAEVEREIARKNERSGQSSEKTNQQRGGVKP